MSCKHIESNGQIRRGKSSIEWHDRNEKPHYYCYGFGYKETGELLEVCECCRQNVKYAQEDLDEYNK